MLFLKSNVPKGELVVLLRSSSNSACRFGIVGVGSGVDVTAAAGGGDVVSEVVSTFVPQAERAAIRAIYFTDLKNLKNNFLGSPCISLQHELIL